MSFPMLPGWNWTVEGEWCVQSFPTRQTHLEISISLTARLPDISLLKTNQCWHFPHASWPLALSLGSLWVKEDICISILHSHFLNPYFNILSLDLWSLLFAKLGRKTPPFGVPLWIYCFFYFEYWMCMKS